ncbi:UbiH/UbiF/VisC/COQ6 family ubiquinone biosynthesis hydroxylase [Marinimicrobium alkaliphilum]|uniref:UbiH/UbiF/VisC/COQ6 family ubiquinone biosynthesis hydroxylase n=1 Tax=Marinimicrobium alkaliphilum TaxID=2202654 RepID=UPI000DB91815|nr:UbiH/UbiF/VisC/COQ6 family ubiquinone biosynthesis hydroxylase [Marinimicrobium alkaliphilum]
MTARSTPYDLIVVGAGLVGASLALAVARARPALSIAVLEASSGQPAAYQGEHFDPRVVALTHRSEGLLADLGVWSSVLAERACAYTDMRVWDGEATGHIHFGAQDIHAEHLGHIVENSLLVRALRTALRAQSGVTLHQAAVLDRLVLPRGREGLTRVSLSNGEQLSAPLVIGADGAQSRVRDLAGLATREWDYGQQGIVTTVRTRDSHQFTAWQRFMGTGPVAFLPLFDPANGEAQSRYCSIVWSADESLADELMALDDPAFCERLGRAFEYRLGSVETCAERFAIPLRQRHALGYGRAGVALVGDAAHTIHPLAGQGVNLGLDDVGVMTAEIERACSRGIPLSDGSVVRRYQRQRLGENLSMAATMEAFKRLFGSRDHRLIGLRNVGLDGVDRLPALKRVFARRATGR